MDRYKLLITGGAPLRGETTVFGGKNTSVAVVPAMLLCDEPCVVENLPDIEDIHVVYDMLNLLGAKVDYDPKARCMTVDPRPVNSFHVPYQYTQRMRASYYLWGALLGRCGQCEVGYPGGCAIGARPMDIHLSALEQMGASIEIKNGYVIARAENGLKGAHLIFNIASVGATCNILMAAALAEGTTVIENAAMEPEIGNLAEMLNAMGAKITGIGTPILTIEGVRELHGTVHKVIPDRIEAGSYAVAAAITRGRIELINAQAATLKTPLRILSEMGVRIIEKPHGIIIDAENCRLEGKDIMTDYYPGFPTGLQAQFLTLMLTADGASMVTETIFENRFMHVPELMRMGANINVHGHASAIVRGVKKLYGAQVMATDLRASFALVLAGLIAEGETIVNRVYHLDRGYEKLEEKLRGVGADIVRIKEPDQTDTPPKKAA